MEFSKYHGLGNDFILVDNRKQVEPLLTPKQAISWCDRHFGIGADGVIFALPGQNGNDYTMRIFNSDGSEPEMCGNGIRCMAKFLQALETEDGRPPQSPHTYRIHTLAGGDFAHPSARWSGHGGHGASLSTGGGDSYYPGGGKRQRS